MRKFYQAEHQIGMTFEQCNFSTCIMAVCSINKAASITIKLHFLGTIINITAIKIYVELCTFYHITSTTAIATTIITGIINFFNYRIFKAKYLLHYTSIHENLICIYYKVSC